MRDERKTVAATLWKSALISCNFWISASIVGTAVTWMFYANSESISSTFADGLLYWSIYSVCLLFLLFVILMIVKRQLNIGIDRAL
jgi:hypothetical protein